MNDAELRQLAGEFRAVLRQVVYLIRAMDAEGELSTSVVSTLNMVSAAPMRVSDIARNAGIRVPSATEQIIKLEAAGLVQRISSDSDARVVLVRLTDKGRDALDAANEKRDAPIAEALASLSEEERQAIAVALPALAKFQSAMGA